MTFFVWLSDEILLTFQRVLKVFHLFRLRFYNWKFVIFKTSISIWQSTCTYNTWKLYKIIQIPDVKPRGIVISSPLHFNLFSDIHRSHAGLSRYNTTKLLFYTRPEMGKETDKVGPCVALTIMFFMISFTFTVMVYLIRAKDLLTEIVVVSLWPVTGFLIVLTFISYLYRSSNFICVLEGYRLKLRRKTDLIRAAENEEEKLKITKNQPWILVKTAKPRLSIVGPMLTNERVVWMCLEKDRGCYLS